MKLPLKPPDIDHFLAQLVQGNHTQDLAKLLSLSCGICDKRGRYLHWDKLRFAEPPEGLTAEEYWFVTKVARNKYARRLSLQDEQGQSMHFCVTDELLRALHWLDQHAAGQVSMPQPIADSGMRDTYLVSSLIEEAINSSQLEGASTTRDVARAMLQQNRKPHDKSEQMIVNNYRAMQEIRELKEEVLSPALIFHLHQVLTENTLDQPEKAGRFRTDEDDVQVVDHRDGQVLHCPPAASSLPLRLKQLCDFANDEDSTNFIHPVNKAIILHFMLGYDHPFVDGNGRTARALFYWYMAKKDFWLIEFVSISKVIKQAPAQYAKAFLYCETDNNDLTYFLMHQIGVLQKSIDELFVFLEQKTNELTQTQQLLKGSKLQGRLNHRQLDIIHHALNQGSAIFTIQTHRHQHATSYQTARTDLLTLSDEFALLDKRKQGKGFVFYVPDDLAQRIENLAG
ncbi:MAG: Fic family protein [Hydrogenovibrio sp.]|uniref:Fic family protein n=1 Tax=Hydrogenovibrio sp. TaxID=2065821 RepID=UPI00286FDC63|nr:Fic family protein [Hydrogenovibrio sp.]MDR9498540.1 Fic family protein [Hydrogenovibrio sp.]MDR9499230.1 Fic family protein [Hydrogenovibrio sp.]